MKVEQACRFRTDTGYAVFAKTDGFTTANEKNMGEVFNDIMNPLMPRPGSSVVTFAVNREDAFLSLGTMRTDAAGRRSVFTHAYIFPAQTYARLMREDPALCLSIPVQGMMSQQQKQTRLEVLEPDFSGAAAFDLDALRQKYRLDDERYTALLFLGCRAITSGASLCLQTARCADPLTLVRDFAYCLAMGLVPMLRGRITYSTAADSRQNLCVQLPQAARIGTGGVGFAVEPPARPVPVQMDPMSRRVFGGLATAGAAERAEILAKMDAWILAVVGEQGVTPALVVASYYMTHVQGWTGQEALTLLNSLLTLLQNPNAVSQALDDAAIRLMDALAEGGVCPNNMLIPLTRYALRTASEAYRASLGRLLQLAGAEAKVNLIASLLEPPLSAAANEVLCGLLENLPVESVAAQPGLDDRLVDWALAEEIPQLTPVAYACTLLDRGAPPAWNARVCRLLDEVADRSPNGREQVILCHLLQKMTRAPMEEGSLLDEAHCARLDAWAPLCVEKVQKVLIDYFYGVRIRHCPDREGQLGLLQALFVSSPDWFDLLMAHLRAEPDCAPGLLEHYETRLYLTGADDKAQLASFCERYNRYQSAQGPFESAVRTHWCRLTRLHLQSVRTQVAIAKDLSLLVDAIQEDLAQVDCLNLSEESRRMIRAEDVEQFWFFATYRDLVLRGRVVPDSLLGFTGPESDKKRAVLEAARAIRDEPHNTEPLCSLLLSGTAYSEMDREEIQKALPSLAHGLVKKDNVLLIDLLLLATASYKGENSAPEFDYEHAAGMVERMNEREPLRPDVRFTLADSCLLRQEPGRQKKLKKALARRELPAFQSLLDELNAGQTGLFGFGRRKAEEESPEQDAADFAPPPPPFREGAALEETLSAALEKSPEETLPVRPEISLDFSPAPPPPAGYQEVSLDEPAPAPQQVPRKKGFGGLLDNLRGGKKR